MTSISKAMRYIIGGLLIGGFWYLNRGRPPWEEALRTFIVFAVIMLILKARLRTKSVNVHLVPLIASKAVLVIAAAIAQEELQHRTSNATLFVAIGLGAAIMLLGPLGDGQFFTRQLPPASSTTHGSIRKGPGA
jgi:peptidoglycan/LPS O-acetylase OafA/YrhL